MTEQAATTAPTGRRLYLLSFAALGVVYGDIGTSPIYALRESFHVSHGVEATRANVFGVLSLIFWSLIIVISVKYLYFVMRADNRGEGGVMALTALVNPPGERTTGARKLLVYAGLFGAALLYSDSMITPAISVLSAVEGLDVAAPGLSPFVIPITVVILFLLFSGQRHGTARVGAVFGPVMTLWFLTLAVLGTNQIIRHPGVLAALNPLAAVGFFGENEARGLLVLGSVFLVVTGGEALYADMGHFGRKPIRLTWFAIVLPALLLNYFGQGAMIIEQPALVEQPFFSMAPSWALYPLLGLSTAATVIASQAVISGAFSLTRQAVLLGYLPRLHIEHTSSRHMGQIYMPAVNWALMLASIGLVLGFRNSSSLAAAYGMAVTTDMVFTTVLFAVVAWRRWGWNVAAVGLLVVLLLAVDLSFWGANLPKIPQGGWFPLLVAAGTFTVMTTWKRGREILHDRLRSKALPLDDFVESMRTHPPHRVPGTAVFMDSSAGGTPPALLHNLKHNWVLHERVVFLTVVTEEAPYVDEHARFTLLDLGAGMHRLTIRVGFVEDVDIPALLKRCSVEGGPFEMLRTSYFLGRERVISTARPGMARWRERLFGVLIRNAGGATEHFNLPSNRVVELGAQIEI